MTIFDRIALLRKTGADRSHAAPNQATFDRLEAFVRQSTTTAHPLVTFDDDGNGVLEYHAEPFMTVTFYPVTTELYRDGLTGNGAYVERVMTFEEIDRFLQA